MFKKVLIAGVTRKEFGDNILKRIKTYAQSIEFTPDTNIRSQLPDVEALIVKFNPVNKQLIDKLPNLKYIGVFATGYGKVDIAYAKEKGIVVTNIPGYSTESVAEFTFAVILERLRQLEEAKVQVRGGDYDESNFSATEIKGKTLGIVGLGRIGTRVAEIAHAFGAEVIYNDYTDKKLPDFTFTELDEVISNSDILSFHLTLSKESEGMMDEKKINSIKEGALVINTAPMEVFGIDALAARLEKGDITFVLDHSDEMTEGNLTRLSKFKNCIIYPPIGYISDEASAAKLEIFVENLEGFVKGEKVNVVN